MDTRRAMGLADRRRSDMLAGYAVGSMAKARKIMTPRFSRRLLSLVMSGVVVMILPCVFPARAQTVVVTANGEPITEVDIEQRTRLNFLTTHKHCARQEVINELIDDKGKIKQAAKLGVEPTSADVNDAYAKLGLRMRITPEQLTKSLEGQGIRLDTLKGRIKAEVARKNLACLRDNYSRVQGGISEKCRLSPIPRIRRVARMHAPTRAIALAQR
jgi:hypothetical protein